MQFSNVSLVLVKMATCSHLKFLQFLFKLMKFCGILPISFDSERSVLVQNKNDRNYCTITVLVCLSLITTSLAYIVNAHSETRDSFEQKFNAIIMFISAISELMTIATLYLLQRKHILLFKASLRHALQHTSFLQQPLPSTQLQRNLLVATIFYVNIFVLNTIGKVMDAFERDLNLEFLMRIIIFSIHFLHSSTILLAFIFLQHILKFCLQNYNEHILLNPTMQGIRSSLLLRNDLIRIIQLHITPVYGFIFIFQMPVAVMALAALQLLTYRTSHENNVISMLSVCLKNIPLSIFLMWTLASNKLSVEA